MEQLEGSATVEPLVADAVEQHRDTLAEIVHQRLGLKRRATPGKTDDVWVRRLQAGSLLIVSPHLDDAALSCAVLLEREEPVDILTVFAGAPEPHRTSLWDSICGFASSAESLPARRREEEEAFRGSCHRVTQMTLLESGYVDGERAAMDGVAVVEAVWRWAGRCAAPIVAIPAGAGVPRPRLPKRVASVIGTRPGLRQHLDHLFVRDRILRAAADDDRVSLVMYEEIPYLFTQPADAEVQRVAAKWRRRASPVFLPVDVVEKARRLSAYASQVQHLPLIDGRPLDDPDALPIVERYWALESRARSTRPYRARHRPRPRQRHR